MAQTKTVPMRKLVYEYRGLIPQIFRSPETLKIMAVSVLLYITGVINTNFFGLYIPNYLGLPEATLAVFPILNAVVMLVFMFAVQHRLEHVRHKTLMWIGIAMHAASQVLLVMIPSGNLLPVFLYTFLSAVGNALVMPRKDTLLALSIDPKERARILALITSFTIAFSSPFGWLSGILSGLDQRLPFVFAGVLFLLAIGIVGSVREGAPEGAEADSCAL